MAVMEREIEAELVRMIEAAGGKCLKWVCPGWAGVPDRICLLPGGKVFFVETKRPKGGRLSKLQEYWGKQLVKLGFRWYTAYDKTDLLLIRMLEL